MKFLSSIILLFLILNILSCAEKAQEKQSVGIVEEEIEYYQRCFHCS
ncbi:MAG: hypothetical protein IH819_02360 [Bacteroidetes bacterium]|nr:hypothetical protein [Bacteroidota bacterium]